MAWRAHCGVAAHAERPDSSNADLAFTEKNLKRFEKTVWAFGEIAQKVMPALAVLLVTRPMQDSEEHHI